MKKSNAILWTGMVGVLSFFIITLLVIKFSLSEHVDQIGVTVNSTEIGTMKVDMSGFSEVDLKGTWRAKIVQGEMENILIKGPEDLLANLSVNRHGDSIMLHMAKQQDDKRKLSLAMTLPALQGLRSKGVADITITGFEPDRFTINTKGVSSIRGEKGRIGKLTYQGEGVSTLDLTDSPTISADLNCEGVVKIDLTMTGGNLTGSLKGVGEVRYTGQTSRESIHRKGPCSVTRL